MTTISFSVGTRIKLGGVDLEFMRKIGDTTWQLENLETGQIIEHEIEDIFDMFREKDIQALSPISNNSPELVAAKYEVTGEEWRTANFRREVVEAISDLPRHKPGIARHLLQMDLLHTETNKIPSASTALRWLKKYTESGKSLISLIPQRKSQGNRHRRYCDEVLEIVNKQIYKTYLISEKPTIQEVVDQCEIEVDEINQGRIDENKLSKPTRRFVAREIEKIDKFERTALREGRDVANNNFRYWINKDHVNRPLEKVEIDHTPIDLIVLDDDTHTVLGRPWATAIIDSFTRSVMAIIISFDPPSFLTVSECLRQAIMPKDHKYLESIGVKNRWVQHGIPSQLVVDNGLEFHSASLENACGSLGIEIVYTPRKTAWLKGKVERFLKTLNMSVSHKLPGTTFSNIFEKGDYDSAGLAVVRYKTLKQIINIWVVDSYHQSVHRGIDTTPHDAWVRNVDEDSIRFPRNSDLFDAILWSSINNRSLTHKGIEFMYLFYNSVELVDLRRKYGEKLKVDIRVNKSDIGQIIVMCPFSTDIYRVNAIDYDYAAGLSLWRHKKIRSFAKAQRKEVKRKDLLDVKRIFNRIVAEEISELNKKSKSRKARWKQNAKADAVDSEKAQIDRELKSLDGYHEEDVGSMLQVETIDIPVNVRGRNLRGESPKNTEEV